MRSTLPCSETTSSQKERIFFDYADLEIHIGNVEQYRKFYVKFSEIEPHSRNPRLLSYRRPKLVNCTIETMLQSG